MTRFKCGQTVTREDGVLCVLGADGKLRPREDIENIRAMVAWRKGNARRKGTASARKEYLEGLRCLRQREAEEAAIVRRKPSSKETSSFQPRARKADESTA